MAQTDDNPKPDSRGTLASLALGIFCSLMASAGQVIFPNLMMVWRVVFIVSVIGALLSVAYLIYVQNGVAGALAKISKSSFVIVVVLITILLTPAINIYIAVEPKKDISYLYGKIATFSNEFNARTARLDQIETDLKSIVSKLYKTSDTVGKDAVALSALQTQEAHQSSAIQSLQESLKESERKIILANTQINQYMQYLADNKEVSNIDEQMPTFGKVTKDLQDYECKYLDESLEEINKQMAESFTMVRPRFYMYPASLIQSFVGGIIDQKQKNDLIPPDLEKDKNDYIASLRDATHPSKRDVARIRYAEDCEKLDKNISAIKSFIASKKDSLNKSIKEYRIKSKL